MRDMATVTFASYQRVPQRILAPTKSAPTDSSMPAATCGKVCVAEVEEIVPVGSLDPDCIHLPSIYVNRLILGAPYEKKIEFRTVREREAA